MRRRKRRWGGEKRGWCLEEEMDKEEKWEMEKEIRKREEECWWGGAALLSQSLSLCWGQWPDVCLPPVAQTGGSASRRCLVSHFGPSLSQNASLLPTGELVLHIWMEEYWWCSFVGQTPELRIDSFWAWLFFWLQMKTNFRSQRV